jgi:hypothetical protein
VARTSRWRIAGLAALLIGAVAVIGLVVGLLVVWLSLDGWVSRYVTDAARERGISVEGGQVEYGIGWVRLRGPRFSLIGVRGVQGSARSVEVRLVGLDPTSIDAEGVTLEVEGSAASLALDLTQWTKNYPSTYALRTVAREVALTWRPARGAAPWIVIRGATVVPTPDGGRFNARKVQAVSLALGEVAVTWTKSETRIGIGFGIASAAQAPIRLSVQHALAKPTADITVVPTDLAKLSGPLGIKLPLENVRVGLTAHLELPARLQTGPVAGTVHLDLHGYVPPHPVELDGFVFGDLTTLDTRFAIPADQSRVTLSETQVVAGALKLRGQGEIVRREQQADVSLGLRGDLPCTALADAAAQNRLGGKLGEIVGKLARQVLQGSVAVLVKIDGNTSALDQAKVQKTIGMGCGLRPLDPTLLAGLQRLLDQAGLPPLPSLPTALPPLPALPTLPTLPTTLPTLPPFPDLRRGGRDAGPRPE